MTKKNRIEIDGFLFDSEGEAVLYLHMSERGLGELVKAQYGLHNPERKWRFDFAFPDKKIFVEVEGGTWVNGRHNRGKGYEEDCRKYNDAAIAGYQVLRFTTDMVNSMEAIATIERVLKAR